nr:hypothetical protein [uncultured Shewanella sp.]
MIKKYITEKSVGNSSSEEIEKELVLIEEQKEVLSNMRKVIDIRESELKNKILPKSDFLENKK